MGCSTLPIVRGQARSSWTPPTRRRVRSGAGVIAATLMSWLAGDRHATGQTNETRAILDALSTIEALAVTLVGVARRMEEDGELDLSSELVRFLAAMQCADEAHVHFWQDAGSTVTAPEFSLPSSALEDQAALLTALVDLKELTLGAYMAASRQLAIDGEARLVEVAFQIGAVEAQHLALLRRTAGVQLPADRAFAGWRFTGAPDAVEALQLAGYLGETGRRVSYPGPMERVCRGVTGLVPDTTDDPPVTPIASPVAVGSA